MQGTKHKIAIFGFGSFPVVCRHLIEDARKRNAPIEWCAILVQPNFRKVIGDILPANEILDVFKSLPRVPVGGPMGTLASYPESLAEDLAAEKRTWRRRKGEWKLRRGIDYYNLYKNFLIDRGVTHILMSMIESPDAKIAVSVAREIGVSVIAPLDLRNLTGTIFSVDCHETPPAYASPDDKSAVLAKKFVQDFRLTQSRARSLPIPVDQVDGDDAILEQFLPSLPVRIFHYVARLLERPDIFEPDSLRASIINNVAPLRELIRSPRGWLNARQYDIDRVEQIPEKSIFFPLQYSPEASINTPEPYFVDQFRLIDALRYAMPSDYVLLIKEHPACINMRATEFLRRVRRSPGVVVIEYSVPAVDIMKKAALTVTITGTAAFEAFLLGRPALALGRGLSSWALGRRARLGSLRADINDALTHPLSDEFVIEKVAKLINARYGFYFDTAHAAGEPMLRAGNMRRFLDALLDHFTRDSMPVSQLVRSAAD